MKKFLLSMAAVLCTAFSASAQDAAAPTLASLEPAEGTEMAHMPEYFYATFNNDSQMGYGLWQVVDLSKDADAYDYILTQGQLKKNAETGKWYGKSYYVEALKMYAGHTYQLQIYPYVNEDARNNEGSNLYSAALAKLTATWAGTTQAYQYAEAQLELLTPSNETIIASGEITAVFTAPVETLTAGVVNGVGGDNTTCATSASDDKKTWTINIPQAVIDAATGSIALDVVAKDAAGRLVKGNVGEEETSCFSWTFYCYNGCPIPSTITPANGSTVTELSTITLSDNAGINLSYATSQDITVVRGRDFICTVPASNVKVPEGALGSKSTSLTVTLPTTITEAGTYQVIFPATYFMIGEEMSSSVTRAFELEYTVAPATPGLVTDPIAGEVEQLKIIYIKMNDASIIAPSGQDGRNVTLKDADGAVIKTFDQNALNNGVANFDDDYMPHAIKLNMFTAITAPGTYTLNIPAGTFNVGENFADNDETNIVWTIKDPNAVNFTIKSVKPYAIELTFEQEATPNWYYTGEEKPVIYNEAGEQVATAGASYADDWDDYYSLKFPFSDDLAGGTYTMQVPAEYVSFVNADYTETPLPAFSVTFTVEAEKAKIVVTPAAGRVESLKEFMIAMDDNSMISPSSQDGLVVSLTDAEGAVIASFDSDVLTAGAIIDEETWMPIAIKLTLANEITAAGTYTLNIPAGIFYVGENMDDNEAASFEWTIKSTSVVAVATSTQVSLTFPETVSLPSDYTGDPAVIKDAATDVQVATATGDYGDDFFDAYTMKLVFSQELPDGTYKAEVPAGFFSHYTESWVEEHLPAFTVSFTIGNPTGINVIAIEGIRNGRFMIDGKLYIVKEGRTYNAAGELIK